MRKMTATGGPSRTWRLVRRGSELYGPLAAAAIVFAALGRLLRWNFAEAPLVILTLPFSLAPLWALAPPVVLIIACTALAAAVWARLRWLGRRYSLPRMDTQDMRAAPGCLTAVVLALFALWVLTSAIAVGVFVNSHWYGSWPKLREEVAAFNVPSGFEKVATLGAGSEACFISCDEPRISVVLKTDLPPSEACRAIEASLRAAAKNVGPPPGSFTRPPNASCFFWGDLPRVYSDAHLWAAVLRGDELRDHWLLANKRTLSFSDTDTVVALLFDSGID